jgi:hypothetical protein
MLAMLALLVVPTGGLRQQCTGGHTACPTGARCCAGHDPDKYSVPGGFGCAPAGSGNWTGCGWGADIPGGGMPPANHSDAEGCCCGPGPSNISTTLKNVLCVPAAG